MSNTVGAKALRTEYVKRIESVPSVSKVDDSGGAFEIEMSDRWSPSMLGNVMENEIDGMPVEIGSRRAGRGTRPSREHTINQQQKALGALQALSGGEVEVDYKAQPEAQAPVIRRRRPGRGSRPIYSKPQTPEFESINITVGSAKEKRIADALIADTVYGAPVTFNILD